MQAMLGRMVFRSDMIFDTPLIAEWGDIRLRKQKIVGNNNQLENKNRKPHTYRIRDKGLLRNKKGNKYEEPYVGPYPITQVWTNGNVTIRQGAVQ